MGVVSVSPVFSNFIGLAVTIFLVNNTPHSSLATMNITNILIHTTVLIASYHSDIYNIHDLYWQLIIFSLYVIIMWCNGLNLIDYYLGNIQGYLAISNLEVIDYLKDFQHKW